MSTPSEKSEANTLDIKLLISSFLKIEPQADEFAATFYYILFEKYPDMVPLFAKTDMEKQKTRLIESLQLVMGNIHNPETSASILRNLGYKHVSYGAVLTDYPLIGDALLQALERHLGKDWNPEVEQAWTIGYQKISDLMIEGTQTVEKSKVNLFDRNFTSNTQDLISINAEASIENIRSVNSGLSTENIQSINSGASTENIQSINSGASTENIQSINSGASTENIRSTSSNSTSVFSKGTLFGGIGIIALLGYMGWRVMQTQPTNSIQPSPIERSK
jgi:nitric oxide dioxygenase